MTTRSRTSRSATTVFRIVAEATTPIASRTFTGEWDSNIARVKHDDSVRKAAGAWIQRLEHETGRDLQEGSMVRILLEKKTTRTITLTDIVSSTEAVLRPRGDRYGNQFWKEDEHDR